MPQQDYAKLNWYRLQQALYAAHGLYDKPEMREEGRRKILEIHQEYARRGLRNVAPPNIK